MDCESLRHSTEYGGIGEALLFFKVPSEEGTFGENLNKQKDT